MKTVLEAMLEQRVLAALGSLGALLIRAWGRTWRVTTVSGEWLETRYRQGQAVIYVFWHESIFPATYLFRGRHIQVLVSQHRDGEIISRIIGRLGYSSVRGSTTRGGSRGLLEMIRLGRQGYSLGITPDGPRGPRRRVQSGVLYIAQRTGLPLVPFAVGYRRGLVLSSWDRFKVPWPFSSLLVVFQEPVWVAEHGTPAELESRRQELEEKLLQATDETRQWGEKA